MLTQMVPKPGDVHIPPALFVDGPPTPRENVVAGLGPGMVAGRSLRVELVFHRSGYVFRWICRMSKVVLGSQICPENC